LEKFKLILSPFRSIQENLALEQFFMMQEGNFLILYKNQNCIVIGRNQVCYSEIALKEQQYQKISIFRRYSGGGTVFLDEGTLNYAFISDYNCEKCSYSFYNKIIIQVLAKIGFKNIIEKGCNINHEDLKISGTAQYKRKNRFIHHGTLLVDANLLLLESVLFQSGSYKTKAKKSEPVKTGNLIRIIPAFTMEEFENCFRSVLNNEYCKSLIELTPNVFDCVTKRKTEFEDKSWTFGNSPYYEFSNEIILPDGSNFKVFFEVKNGKVTNQFFSKNNPFPKVDFIGNFHSFDDFSPIIYDAIGKSTSIAEVDNICFQFFNSERRA
jgi:lipoate-protein ligase A